MNNYNKFIIQRRFSRITNIKPDKYIFPLYYEAYKLEFDINEGEGLFIPFGWYHYVISEDVNKDTSLNIAISHSMKSSLIDYQLSTNLYNYIDNMQKYNLLYDNNNGNDINNIINLHKQDSIPFKLLNMPKTNITINNLKNTFNNDDLIINISNSNFFVSNYIKEYRPYNCQEKYMNFNDFLNKNNKETNYNYYLIQESETYLEKLNKIKTPYFINNCINRNLWINFGNVYTALHYDCYDNFLWQIQGRKRILLFPPSERNKLYMYNPYPLDFLYNIKNDNRYYNVLKF
jgi:ribosomal protein L16 Arg81 hydroxylase